MQGAYDVLKHEEQMHEKRMQELSWMLEKFEWLNPVWHYNPHTKPDVLPQNETILLSDRSLETSIELWKKYKQSPQRRNIFDFR